MLNFIIHFRILLISFYVPYQLSQPSICYSVLVFLPIFKACRTFGSTHVKSREKKKTEKCDLIWKWDKEFHTHPQEEIEQAHAIQLHKTAYYVKLQHTGGKLSFSHWNIPLPEITYPTHSLHTELLLGCIPKTLWFKCAQDYRYQHKINWLEEISLVPAF